MIYIINEYACFKSTKIEADSMIEPSLFNNNYRFYKNGKLAFIIEKYLVKSIEVKE